MSSCSVWLYNSQLLSFIQATLKKKGCEFWTLKDADLKQLEARRLQNADGILCVSYTQN